MGNLNNLPNQKTKPDYHPSQIANQSINLFNPLINMIYPLIDMINKF